jgi:hypothetical protein
MVSEDEELRNLKQAVEHYKGQLSRYSDMKRQIEALLQTRDPELVAKAQVEGPKIDFVISSIQNHKLPSAEAELRFFEQRQSASK